MFQLAAAGKVRAENPPEAMPGLRWVQVLLRAVLAKNLAPRLNTNAVWG
jgi:hypothetical protein